MSPSASIFTIWTTIMSTTLHLSHPQYITTTQREYLYSYQGYDDDTNYRPNYITITRIDDVTPYSHISPQGSRFTMLPDDPNGFSIQLILNSPLTFHPTQITKLTLQVGSDTPIGADFCQLIVAFSQSSSIYISSMISIDESSDNLIYPACDTSFPYTQSFANGNIQQIVDIYDNNCDRLCKAFGQEQNFSSIPRFQPTFIPPNISYPLTFIIENHPVDNYSIFSYINPGVQLRSCGFAQAWQADTTLDVFFSPDVNEQFDITYINITHVLYATYSPTLDPTAQPTNLTQNPTFYPTQHPTLEPTSNPTLIPSHNPTLSTQSSDIFSFNSTFVFVESTLQNSDMDTVKVDHVETMFSFDILMVIVVGVMIFCFVLVGLDYIYLMRYVTDELHYDIVIVIGLRICNMILDGGILYRMCVHYYDEKGNALLMVILILCSLILLVLTYLMNVFSMNKIVKLKCQTEGPMLWFSKYMLLFVFLVFITCDSYLIVKLISCNIFGMDIFNSGHSTVEFNKIRWIKFVTIVLQNIPHIIIQIIFAVLVLNNMNLTIMISVIVSFILSIPLLISWSLTKINNKLFVWQEYDIEMLFSLNENDTSAIKGEDTELTVTKYGGNKSILKKKLSSILGINSNKLEIGFIDDRNKDDLIRIHILHQIPATSKGRNCKSDLTVLYEGKYDILAKELRQIYNIPFTYNILCRLLMNGCAAGTSPLATVQHTENDTEMVHIKVSTNNNKMTPFELVTSRSEADYDEEFINQILDETQKKMAENKNNNGALMVINDSEAMIHKTSSVIAVTPMGDDGDEVDVEDDESSTSCSNSNDSGPDLPCEDKENGFGKHFQRLSSVDFETMPNVPLPKSIVSEVCDGFDVVDNDEDSNPFIMAKIDDIAQPIIEENVGDVSKKGYQDEDR